jgi:hypothetical protein
MGSPFSEMDFTSLAWCEEAIRPVQITQGGMKQTTSLHPTQKSSSSIKLRANTTDQLTGTLCIKERKVTTTDT